MKINKNRFILFIGDIFIISISFYLAIFLRTGAVPGLNWQRNIFALIYLIIISELSFYIFGIYDNHYTGLNFRDLILFVISFIFIVFFGILIFYISPFFIGRGIFLLFLINFIILITVWRIIFFNFVHIITVPERIIVLGSQKEKDIISRLISKDKTYVIENEIDYISPNNKCIDNKIVKRDKIDIQRADIIIIGKYPINAKLASLLIEKKLKGTRIIQFASFYEMVTNKLPVLLVDDEWFINCSGFEKLADGYFPRIKRIMDIIFSSLNLVITSPLFLLIPVFIKLDSKGPVFYIQERCGLDEKRFKLIKFRTMVNNAEENGPQWAEENDPRVTRVGKILRKMRLDELPQLINVLRGEMSLIGPRPERDYFIRELKARIPYYSLRFYVKPGLTGWAQINYRYGASIEDAIEKLAYDLYYIKNMSLLLDISIILKTIRVVLLGHGAR